MNLTSPVEYHPSQNMSSSHSPYPRACNTEHWIQFQFIRPITTSRQWSNTWNCRSWFIQYEEKDVCIVCILIVLHSQTHYDSPQWLQINVNYLRGQDQPLWDTTINSYGFRVIVPHCYFQKMVLIVAKPLPCSACHPTHRAAPGGCHIHGVNRHQKIKENQQSCTPLVTLPNKGGELAYQAEKLAHCSCWFTCLQHERSFFIGRGFQQLTPYYAHLQPSILQPHPAQQSAQWTEAWGHLEHNANALNGHTDHTI